jgi:histidine triad (HIT) family protein
MSKPQDCLFCKMIEGQIPSPRVYEDDSFICIRDIRPQADTHLLVIPKEHISSLAAAFPESENGKVELVGRLFQTATKIAREQRLLPGGFRSVMNTEKNGGQTVYHIHLHILGGQPLGDDFG